MILNESTTPFSSLIMPPGIHERTMAMILVNGGESLFNYIIMSAASAVN